MSKYIREGRFGRPKSFKTGAVVGTYPRPLLVIEYDPGGWEVVTSPVVTIVEKDLAAICAKKSEELPPITGIDLAALCQADLKMDFVPTRDSAPLQATINIINELKKHCPFKTVVLDPITGLSEAILSHISATSQASLADPRKWASMAGSKVKQVISTLNTLPCHTVVLFHDELDKNEITGEVNSLPAMHSKIRGIVGAVFSQWLYSTKDIIGGVVQPVVYTTDQPLKNVKGIGCRWPANLPPICKPTFMDIYGKETF